MPKGEETTRSRPVLLVGSGQRPRELGAVLSALGAVRARSDGETGLEPHRPMSLSDLEELLAQRPAEGTLILDYERVPGEDIGFVRRFLERHSEWRLVVVGEDVSDRRARSLLGLPRAQWLPWPPDLDQISALLTLPELAAGGPTRPARESAPDPEPIRRVKSVRKSPEPAAEAAESAQPEEPLDVGALVEELLAGASLGEGSPRYLFRCDESLLVYRERAPLATALEHLLTLGRQCAGEAGVVSAQVDPSPDPADPEDTARIRIDFPRGELPDELLPTLLDRPLPKSARIPRELALAARAARRAAESLSRSGARVALFAEQPERLRIEVEVSAEGLVSHAPEQRRVKPEDPFA